MMSKSIGTFRGLSVHRFAGPSGEAMLQLTLPSGYAQFPAIEFGAWLNEIREAVDRELVASQVPLHVLKSRPANFERLWRGDRTSDVRRRDDRSFQVRDVVLLREYSIGSYSGRWLKFEITGVVPLNQLGIGRELGHASTVFLDLSLIQRSDDAAEILPLSDSNRLGRGEIAEANDLFPGCPNPSAEWERFDAVGAATPHATIDYHRNCGSIDVHDYGKWRTQPDLSDSTFKLWWNTYASARGLPMCKTDPVEEGRSDAR